MAEIKIGLQLYSVRDALKQDWEGTLRKVKEMGYAGVEIAGLCDATAAQWKALCDELGLEIVSAHTSFYGLDEAHFEVSIAPLVEMGLQHIVIPGVKESDYPSAAEGNAKRLIDRIRTAALLAKKHNLTLHYHNHAFEFYKIDGENFLDLLYRSIEPQLLQAELDLAWVAIGKENPAQYLRKYEGRTEIVHLKDYAFPYPEDPEKYDLRPVGYGLQDIPTLLCTAKETNVKWLIVELDWCATMKQPQSELVAMARNYLKTLDC